MTALPLTVFDVNETLLDLDTMDPAFQRIFGDRSAMRLWFANFIMYPAASTHHATSPTAVSSQQRGNSRV